MGYRGHVAARSPSMAVRLGALLRRSRLDRILAQGRDPATPASHWRARQLTEYQTRLRLAQTLDQLLDVVDGRRRRAGSAVPLNAGELRRCRGLVDELIVELVSDHPVTPRGVLKLQELLRDGCSPLYALPAPEGALEFELRHARTALLLL